MSPRAKILFVIDPPVFVLCDSYIHWKRGKLSKIP
jgi:hypothetical protein